MRLKTALAIAAALAVLALVLRQVTQAVHRTFGGRPGIAQLASTTPAFQNGLTLMAISRVSPDRWYSFSERGQENNGGSTVSPEYDTGLWIKLPPDVSLPFDCSHTVNNPCLNQLTLTARASDGREMRLPWRTFSSSGGNSTYILASIPAGYPDTVRWADVTLEDHHGDTAKWRILNLAPMQHVLAPPVTPQTTFHQGSISATADAWKASPSGNRTEPMILFDLHGTITNAEHQWEMGHFTETREWEPPNRVPQEAGNTFGANKTGRKVSLEMSQQQFGWNRTEPYINDNHWVRSAIQLQEFETYDEMVTFHNVSVLRVSSRGRSAAGPFPQTITSPSGVTVTLVDVQNQKKAFGRFGGNEVTVRLAYPQTRIVPSLPGSPLWRKYKRSLALSADLALAYHGSSSSQGDKDGTYTFRLDKPLPQVIANFPLIIRQRVDLRTVPMTFTLPVLDKAP